MRITAKNICICAIPKIMAATCQDVFIPRVHRIGGLRARRKSRCALRGLFRARGRFARESAARASGHEPAVLMLIKSARARASIMIRSPVLPANPRERSLLGRTRELDRRFFLSTGRKCARVTRVVILVLRSYLPLRRPLLFT